MGGFIVVGSHVQSYGTKKNIYLNGISFSWLDKEALN